MIKEVLNIMNSTLPMISIASMTASAFMGRKFGLAIGYDISSRITRLMGKRNVAEEYSKTSNDYWTLAKKDAFRDLTAAGGFIALAVASNYANNTWAKEEAKEPGWFDNVPVLNTLIDYKKTVLLVTGLSLTTLFSDSLNKKLEEITKKMSDFLIPKIISEIKNKQQIDPFYEWWFGKLKEYDHNPTLVQQYYDLRAQIQST